MAAADRERLENAGYKLASHGERWWWRGQFVGSTSIALQHLEAAEREEIRAIAYLKSRGFTITRAAEASA